MKIRFINSTDAADVLAIYAPYILETGVSFETTVPTLEEFTSRIEHYTQKYPWLVAEENGKVVGYAYASKHRDREAYQWCVESSVYLHPSCRGRGIAQMLYVRLFDILTSAGFVNVYAGITQPNEASNKLHERMGFELVGTYRKIGYKLGRWHDVLWMSKVLVAQEGSVPEIKDYRSFEF